VNGYLAALQGTIAIVPRLAKKSEPLDAAFGIEGFFRL
jgi:hypothetical protein